MFMALFANYYKMIVIKRNIHVVHWVKNKELHE